jgi:hypothetical protein
MTQSDIKEFHRRLVRIETRLVLLIEALGFAKTLPGHPDNDCKVVHIITGTKELT